MKTIPLTRGLFAVVDDDDFDELNKFSWRIKEESNTCYAITSVKRRTVRMHRLLLGAPNGLDVDHRDGNGLNNQRSNLRLATRTQNLRNITRKSPGCSSRFKGVSYEPNRCKWSAKISINNKTVSLGRFQTEVAAQEAYASAARQLFGEFAAPYVEAAE